MTKTATAPEAPAENASKLVADTDWGMFTTPVEEVETATGAPRVTIEDIPTDIRKAVELSLERDKAQKFDFGTMPRAQEFLRLARKYAVLRDPRVTVRTFSVSEDDAKKGITVLRVKPFEARKPKSDAKTEAK